MSENGVIVADADLQAYVDGRLSATQQERVAAAIAADPELAHRADELRRVTDLLCAAYDSTTEDTVPVEMLRTVMVRKPAYPMWIAASIAWMTVGAVIGAILVSQNSSAPEAEVAAARPLVQEAAYAHTVYVPEKRHAVEAGPDETEHLNRWLSKRLDHPVTALDMRDAGYQLVGGRMLNDSGRPAAQFMYEDDEGLRITLFIRNHQGLSMESALQFTQNDELGVVYWVDGPLAYALSGSTDQASLERVAVAMRSESTRLKAE